MQGIEEKLQQFEVYELFQELLKQVIVARPDKPLDFILKKLNEQPSKYFVILLQICNRHMCIVRRVFFLGPPGCSRLENSGALAEYFQWKHISTGDTLRSAAEAKTPAGQRIADCLTKFQYVDDEIVIDAVSKEIQEAEKNG